VARANFAELTQVLRVFSARSVAHVYLATARGALIADSRSGPAERKTKDLASGVADRLLAADGGVVEHRGIDGIEVLASAQRLSRTPDRGRGARARRRGASQFHPSLRLCRTLWRRRVSGNAFGDFARSRQGIR